MMRIIRIFVASSIVSFCSERKRMGALFCEWNNRLVNKSIFLDVKFCEELDNAVPEKRKQDEYNSYIENSDLFVMLTDSECGNYTMEEFEVALHSKNKPRILVFCREYTTELSDYVERIKNTIGNQGEFVFYSNYKTEVEQYLLSYFQNYIKKSDINTVPDKKVTKILFFLGASELQYEDERNEILRFILSLNEKMLKRGIYIQAEPDVVNNSTNWTVQIEKHKILIDESETAFFLFFSEIDTLLEKDFNYAVESFKKKKYPKIFTYFFNQVFTESEQIVNLKRYIDCEMNHYYSEFSNVDSIKLSILIQLADKHIPGFSISVDDGRISDEIQRQDLLDVSSLNIFSKNDTLINLRKKLDNLSHEYENVAKEFSNDYERRDLIVKLSEIDDAMNIVSEKIHKEENETLKMLFEMHRSVANGEMKQIVKKAYSYLEAGKIVEASKILNKQTVDAIYSEYLNAQITNLSQEIRDAIQMYKYSIHIQKMLEESEDTIHTIISCYEEIMKYVDASVDVDIDVVLDYVEYLDNQSSKSSERIIRKVEYLANNPERQIKPITWARLYAVSGMYYLKQYDCSMAEKYLKRYLDIIENLYNTDKQAFAFEYAKACLKYSRIGTSNKANYIERGLEILIEACKDNTESAEQQLELARYYYERGCLYQNCDWKREIESFTRAKELLKKNNVSDQLLADVYNNLAEIIRENDVKRVYGTNVSYYHDLAISILEKGYRITPEKYAEALGDVYNNKAVYFIYYGKNYSQSLENLKKCENVYLYLYKKNPIRGGLGLAECYIQMANTYESLENNEKAIAYSEKGISLLETLTEVNRERYAIPLARAYSETGQMYLLFSEKQKITEIRTAVAYLCKCLDTLEDTRNEFIQQKQAHAVMDMLIGIFQCIKDNKEVPEDLYILVDRIFKFSYKYIWPDMKKQTVFVKLMFEMGYSLAERYPKDSESAKEFYYPAMMDICEQRLADKTLDLESRMFTNIIMAANVGMIGEVEKGQEYLDQALFTSLKMAQKDKGAFKAVLGRKKKRSATKKRKKK